jgi:hypothetical protein
MNNSDDSGADGPDDALPEPLERVVVEWVAGGASPAECVERMAFLETLAAAEYFGLVARTVQPDGTTMVVERDPFAELPLTFERPDATG